MPATLRSASTLTGLSTTNGYIVWYPDTTRLPFLVSVAVDINSSNANFTVQHTLDYTGSSTFVSTAATWFDSSGIVAASTHAFTAYNFPVTAIRLKSTGGSSEGTMTATFVQAG